MGRPEINKDTVGMPLFLNLLISLIIVLLFFEKFKSSLSPSPSAYGLSPYTKIT